MQPLGLLIVVYVQKIFQQIQKKSYHYTDGLLMAISNCATADEIKTLIQKSIDDNHVFEKDSWNPLTKSHYARELEQCNKIIDGVKLQMA